MRFMRGPFPAILAGLLAVPALYLFLQSDLIRSGGGAPPAGATFSGERRTWEWQRLQDPAIGDIPQGIRRREIAFAATLPNREEVAMARPASATSVVWQRRGPWNVGGRTRALGIDVTGEDTIIAGGASGRMWRSSDGGSSWVQAASPDAVLGATALVQDTRPGKEHIWYHGTGELRNSASGLNPYALFVGDGLFRSTDNGRSWHHLATTASGTPAVQDKGDIVWRVAIDPSNMDEDEIYLAVSGSLLRSTDGGESWTTALAPSLSQTRPGDYSDVVVTDNGVVYAIFNSEGLQNGEFLYRSEDGITFNRISPPNFPRRHKRIVIGLAPSNQNVLYFFGETPGYGIVGKSLSGTEYRHSLWKYTYLSGDGSGDNGEWEDRSSNLPSYDGILGEFHSQGGYDLHIAVKPDDEDVVFLGTTNLYRSTTGFADSLHSAWVGGYRNVSFNYEAAPVIVDYIYPNHHPDLHAIAFSPSDPNVVYTGSDGGVHRTWNGLEDSIRWTSLNNGYLTTQFYSIAINQGVSGDQMIVGGMQDNGTWRSNSENATTPWVATGSGDGGHAAVGNGGKMLCISKQSGRTYRVDLGDDGEVTGSTRVDPEGFTTADYLFISPLLLDPNDSRVLYTAVGNSLMYNEDITAIPLDNEEPTAIGWHQVNASFGTGPVITAMGMSQNSPSGQLWVASFRGGIFRVVNPTSDEPTTLNVTPPDFPSLSFAYVSSIAVDPQDGRHVIVCISNYGVQSLYRTTDAGETWEKIGGNLEENPDGTGDGPSCRSVAILHRGGGTVYLVGTSVGLFSTTEINGESTVWTQEGKESIGSVVIEMLAARQSDGFVAIATHGDGVYSGTVGLLGVPEDLMGHSLDISSIHPHPVRERGQVDWSLGGEGVKEVKVDLIDVHGRLSRRIRGEQIGPGRYTDRLPVEGLSPGTYFVRIEADDESLVRSIIIVGDD